jgi:hypothetical protein
VLRRFIQFALPAIKAMLLLNYDGFGKKRRKEGNLWLLTGIWLCGPICGWEWTNKTLTILAIFILIHNVYLSNQMWYYVHLWVAMSTGK